MIARRLGTNCATTLKNLALLEKENLLEHRLSGRTRFFRFAKGLKAKAAREVFGRMGKHLTIFGL